MTPLITYAEPTAPAPLAPREAAPFGPYRTTGDTGAVGTLGVHLRLQVPSAGHQRKGTVR
jgi:hypothetical protein